MGLAYIKVACNRDRGWTFILFYFFVFITSFTSVVISFSFFFYWLKFCDTLGLSLVIFRSSVYFILFFQTLAFPLTFECLCCLYVVISLLNFLTGFFFFFFFFCVFCFVLFCFPQHASVTYCCKVKTIGKRLNLKKELVSPTTT